MEDVLLIARSITRAQRMDSELRRRGITAELIRPPVGLTDKGCAYALRLPQRQMEPALRILQATGLVPYQIFRRNGNDVREVVL